MDRLESLGSTLSQITMYDIKSMYNQAKNVVLNVSEMEAKVREATNDEPWGASSTLMQDIAQGTFSFQYFNEIMPCIYARFMEKEARQWRQIYKALQLLEYLIKHGSERVVDDARSHVSTIKMLRNFHYIDDKGKDEGVNVRNRSRELVELLSDVDKIRAERRKAKANKHKYTGTGSDGFGGGMSFGGSRYGGFGNDSLGGGGSGSHGNDYVSYGAGGSGGSSSFRDDTRRGGFEEYNAGDDEVLSTSPTAARSQNSGRIPPTRKATAPAPVPPPAPEEDLLGGLADGDAFGSSNVGGNTNASAGFGGLAMNKDLPAVSKPSVGIDGADDDFADFQAAPVQSGITSGTNATTATKPNLMDILGSTTAGAHTTGVGFGQVKPPGGMGMGGSLGMGMGGMHRPSPSLSQTSQYSSPMMPQMQQTQNLFGGAAPLKPTSPTTPSFTSTSIRSGTPNAQTKPKTGGGANFDDLWSMSLGGGATKPPGASEGMGKSIKDLEREKAMAGLWGGQKPGGGPNPGASAGGFGSFGNSAGKDDLLL